MHRYLGEMETFTINSLGHQGDGIADGPLYAPLTLPGEVVVAHRDGTRLTDVRVQVASDERVSAPCRHFKLCGGCQLQHASDAFVSEWKVNIVRETLFSRGLETNMRSNLTSQPNSRRRATLSVRRTKKGAMAGFHARGSDVIVEVPDCQLLHPDLMVFLPAVEALALHGASRKSKLSVTITRSDSGPDVSVDGGKQLDGPLRAALAYWAETSSVARLSWDGEVVAMRAAPIQKFGMAQVVPPPGAFLQATGSGEADLVASVREAVGNVRQVADLFSGCGTFALPLAENAEVHAVEGDAAMVAALDQGWRRAEGLKRVTHEARDLFRRPLYPDELSRFQAVVLDPPRAGAQAQVEQLARSDVPAVAYVSCNPMTFARDAAMLVEAGYMLDWVQTIDQFRWSSHIELAGAFRRTTAG